MGIRAISGDDFETLRVGDVKDLSAVAPSFTVSQSYQGAPIYTLHGSGLNTINISSTSTVGSYVDEAAYAYPLMPNGPIFDLQRVKVLEGPQGALSTGATRPRASSTSSPMYRPTRSNARSRQSSESTARTIMAAIPVGR